MSLNRVWSRLQGMVAFGETTAAMDDAGATGTVQAKLTDLETHPGLQVINHFGFSSSAPIGARIVALFGGGDRSKGVILGTVDPGTRSRGLNPGETVIYNAHGMTIRLSAAGIAIDAGGKPVTFVNGEKARFEMPIESTKEVTAMCDGAFVTLSQHKGHTGGGQPPTPNT